MAVKLSTPLLVTLADGTELRVSSDQRDLARFEASDAYRPTARHLQARHLAWTALVRTEQYTGSWKRFNETDCLEVESLLSPDSQEGEQGLDPGSPATPDTD